MNNGTTEKAIAANLGALTEMLRKALADAEEAMGYVAQGNRNAAIGTICDLDRLLADATALHGAALALHRRTPA